MANFQFTVETDVAGPLIAPQDPLPNDVDVGVAAPITFQITDVSGVDLSSVIVRINGVLLFSGGAEQNGATVTTTTITNGYDFSVTPPTPLVDGLSQVVFVSAEDVPGNLSELLYTFFTGIKPRVISAENTAPGIIVVRFNEPMLLDDVFRRTQNFVIEPVGDAPSVEVLEVRTSESQPDAATLIFDGGGSPYTLSVSGVTDLSGNPIDPDFSSITFNIGLPGGVVEPDVHLFDTVFGPLGIGQRIISRRTIDALVINRAIDLGVNKQLKLRLDALGASIPLRSGKDGGRRR